MKMYDTTTNCILCIYLGLYGIKMIKKTRTWAKPYFTWKMKMKNKKNILFKLFIFILLIALLLGLKYKTYNYNDLSDYGKELYCLKTDNRDLEVCKVNLGE